MVHIYCGDGKGKSTSAMGLALRSAGRGNRVVICQFMKSGKSGERMGFERFENVKLLPVPQTMKFVFQMTEEEKAETRAQMTAQFEEAAGYVRRGECDLLVLDEMCSAVTTGMVPLEKVTAFLDEDHEAEIVMTGRNPEQALQDRADYITEMRKIKHPFDKGVPARIGVEW